VAQNRQDIAVNSRDIREHDRRIARLEDRPDPVYTNPPATRDNYRKR